MVKKRIVYIHRDPWYNDGNHPDMAPFWSPDDGKTLWVEQEQYDAWAKTDALDLIRGQGYDTIEPKKTVPHLLSDSDLDSGDPPEWFYAVYRAINSRGNARRWWSLVEGGALVPLAADDTISATLIQEAMDAAPCAPEHGWFVKCGTCSTKHHYPPVPVFSGIEAADHLNGALSVQRSLHRKTAECVLLRPWDPQINDVSEVRVFVRQQRVVGVSQQACYMIVPFMTVWPEDDMVAAFQRLYDDMRTRLPPERRFDHECTFDGYFSTDTDGNLTGHLIEINGEAFGWGPAGASLFHWRYNPPPQAHEEPEFVVASVLG